MNDKNIFKRWLKLLLLLYYTINVHITLTGKATGINRTDKKTEINLTLKCIIF